MARKILRRVSDEAVLNVYGMRRVHRAGSRRCVFCNHHHDGGNTQPDNTDNTTNNVVNISVTSSVADIYTISNNIIMRNDTTVTMMTVHVPQTTVLNLRVGDDNVDDDNVDDDNVDDDNVDDDDLTPATPRIYVDTHNPLDQSNVDDNDLTPAPHRIHADTLNPLDQSHADAPARSLSFARGDRDRRYTVLMTIHWRNNMILL